MKTTHIHIGIPEEDVCAMHPTGAAKIISNDTILMGSPELYCSDGSFFLPLMNATTIIDECNNNRSPCSH